MKKTYESPQIEVVNIEIEDAVLSASTGGGVTGQSNETTQTKSGSGFYVMDI